MLPPFLRDLRLSFPVDVSGADFYCPVGTPPSATTGISCSQFVVSSIEPQSVNLAQWQPSQSLVATIAGSGFKSAQCGDHLRVVVGGVAARVIATTDAAIQFELPRLQPQLAPVKVLWGGEYYAGTQMGDAMMFKYMRPCPNDCSCRGGDCGAHDCHGCCVDDMSGRCACKPGFEGDDCSLLSCPDNCTGHGACDHATGECHCRAPFYGKACAQATQTCPGNCSGNGLCDPFKGLCVCKQLYWGEDCSLRACPPYNVPYCTDERHGICDGSTGECHCREGFAGPSCSVSGKKCPGNCTDAAHGNCDHTTGQCLCRRAGELQYGGDDCSAVVCVRNCSGVGTCNTATGRCECPEGLTGLDCSVVNRPCPRNCSGADRGVCNAQTGNCTCKRAFNGADCSQRVCLGAPECNSPHGICDGATGKCSCQREGSVVYTGEACTTVVVECPGNCNGTSSGSCDQRKGECHCKYPHWGERCELLHCPSDCSGRGDCNPVTGKCKCYENYNSTDDCSIYKVNCKAPCGNGQCDTKKGLCVCNPGWADGNGTFCGVRVCIKNCNGHGDCRDGNCACHPTYTGIDCSLRDLPCHNNCSLNGTSRGSCDRRSGVCRCHPGYEGLACERQPCYSFKNCSGSGHGECDYALGRCACNTAAGWLPPSCDVNSCSHLAYCTSGTHGSCNKSSGTCICKEPFYGERCEKRPCPQGCSGNGACNETTGFCTCAEGWQGRNCSLPVRQCPGDCSGRGKCDTISGVCACHADYLPDDCSRKRCTVPDCNGHGVCNTGVGRCECHANWTGAACNVANRDCPNNCSSNGQCDRTTGKCVCAWKFSSSPDCSVGVCVPACQHCGVCDNRTAKCVCQWPYSGLTCTHAERNCPLHCSGHGRCNDNNTCTCTGTWQPPDCSWSTCPDCGPHGICNTTSGRCVCAEFFSGRQCQMGNLPCEANCSGHGVCNSQTGNCSCSGLWQLPDCSRSRCRRDCSGHGDCDERTGKCQCHKDYSGEFCERVFIPCTADCGQHGSCNTMAGKCLCTFPYWGDQCQNKDCELRCNIEGTMSPKCHNYSDPNCRCTDGLCHCIPGEWTGSTCSDLIPKICPGNCSGYECNPRTGICACPLKKRSSLSCNETKCPGDCKKHGTCDLSVGVCLCDDEYTGQDCALRVCPNNCTGRGKCNHVEGTCRCLEGWGGLACDEKVCPGGCNEKGNGGSCVDGKCKCKASFKGDHCDEANYLMIILVSVAGGLVLVGGSTAGFLLVRRAMIKRLQNKRNARLKSIRMNDM
eukprot:m51a1_g2052 putative egf-like domain-containing protein (1267) ;mRNA; f:1393315-1397842